jgi:hypothetical protein
MLGATLYERQGIGQYRMPEWVGGGSLRSIRASGWPLIFSAHPISRIISRIYKQRECEIRIKPQIAFKRLP